MNHHHQSSIIVLSALGKRKINTYQILQDKLIKKSNVLQ